MSIANRLSWNLAFSVCEMPYFLDTTAVRGMVRAEAKSPTLRLLHPIKLIRKAIVETSLAMVITIRCASVNNTHAFALPALLINGLAPV